MSWEYTFFGEPLAIHPCQHNVDTEHGASPMVKILEIYRLWSGENDDSPLELGVVRKMQTNPKTP